MTEKEMVDLRDYVDTRIEALKELNEERFKNIREAAALEAETKAQGAASNVQRHILTISLGVTLFATLLETTVAIILHFLH